MRHRKLIAAMLAGATASVLAAAPARADADYRFNAALTGGYLRAGGLRIDLDGSSGSYIGGRYDSSTADLVALPEESYIADTDIETPIGMVTVRVNLEEANGIYVADSGDAILSARLRVEVTVHDYGETCTTDSVDIPGISTLEPGGFAFLDDDGAPPPYGGPGHGAVAKSGYHIDPIQPTTCGEDTANALNSLIGLPTDDTEAVLQADLTMEQL